MGPSVNLLAQPGTGLEIRVMGPLEVRVDGAPIIVDTRKALAILALLAVEDRPFSRDELAALLWPESDDSSARGALRRTLSVLRTSLGGRWLQADRGTVALAGDGIWVDAAVLGTLGGHPAAAELQAAAHHLRGPFLAGFSLRDSPEFDDWRATRAAGLERSVSGLLDRLAEAADAEGDLAAALAAASRRVELDSLDEGAHRRVMELLARSGDRAGAVRQYRACVATLERELGVGPLDATRDLYEAIRDGRIPMARPQPVAIAPVPDGSGATAAGPAALPLVGRRAELQQLLALWRDCETGGALAVVEGEAGIGKTRLAEVVAQAVRDAGGLVLAGRSYPAESTIPFGPIGGLLGDGIRQPDAAARLLAAAPSSVAEAARLVPAIRDIVGGPAAAAAPGPPLTEPAARLRLFDGIAATIAGLVAGPRPGLILVDDLAWADASSIELVAYVVNRLVDRPLLVLVTWRREDVTEAVARIVDAAGRAGRSTVLELPRLDRMAIEDLVRAVGRRGADVDVLAAESEGLPLYLAELLSNGEEAGQSSIPRGVRSVLAGRLSGLGGTAAQILAAAAVVGRSFDFDLVRKVSGRTPQEAVDGLDELLSRGIIRELAASGSGSLDYDFAHARLRDVAYEGISLARRRLLHGRAADAIRARAVGERDAVVRSARIAAHERDAGRFPAAAEAFAEAGHRAAAVYAPTEAVAHFEAALGLGHPDRSAIRTAIGDARIRLGDYAGAVEALEAAAGETSDTDRLAAIEQRLGTVHARRGDLATADSHLAAAEDLLAGRPADGPAGAGRARPAGHDPSVEAGPTAGHPGPTARLPGLARVLAERAMIAHRRGDDDRAEWLAKQAFDAGAEPHSGPAGRPRAAQVLGLVALGRNDLDGARADLTRALALSEPADPPVAVAARHALALVARRAGDLPTAIDLAAAALVDGRRLADRHVEAALENTLADLLHEAGRTEESMEHLKRAVTIFAEVGGGPGALEPEIWKLVEW